MALLIVFLYFLYIAVSTGKVCALERPSRYLSNEYLSPSFMLKLSGLSV